VTKCGIAQSSEMFAFLRRILTTDFPARHKPQPNPKSEYRNPKQIRMRKTRNSKQIQISKIAEILKNEYSAPFEFSIILSFEIVSDFGFRASDFIIPLTNIAEHLVKNARLSFRVVRIGTDFLSLSVLSVKSVVALVWLRLCRFVFLCVLCG
jgi:hypothetical protein